MGIKNPDFLSAYRIKLYQIRLVSEALLLFDSRTNGKTKARMGKVAIAPSDVRHSKGHSAQFYKILLGSQ